MELTKDELDLVRHSCHDCKFHWLILGPKCTEAICAHPGTAAAANKILVRIQRYRPSEHCYKHAIRNNEGTEAQTLAVNGYFH